MGGFNRMRRATVCLLPLLLGCSTTESPKQDSTMPDRVALDGQLSHQQALEALNDNIPSIVPCTKAAKKVGEQFELVLGWNVRPDGRVTRIDIKRSGGRLDETLRTCLVTAMAQWTFPTSKLGTRIEHIPLRVGGGG